MTNWASRPYKRLMRDYQLQADRHWKSAIFLPGWDEAAETGCLCIERGLEIGAIDLTSRIIAVERRPDLVERIAGRLASFGFATPPHLHASELCDLRLASCSIDFAMLDLLGTLDQRLATWFGSQLAPALRPGATLSITFTLTFRNNMFMERCAYAWRANDALRYRALDYASRFGIIDDDALIHLVTLKSCLAGFAYDYQRAQIYKDSRRVMLAVRCEDIRPTKSDWPSVDEVLTLAKQEASLASIG